MIGFHDLQEVNMSNIFFAAWIAKETGYLVDEGLDVDPIRVES
jgi:hypothetical protein